MTMCLFPDGSVPFPSGGASTCFVSPASSCKAVSLGLLSCLLSCLSPLAASDLTPVALHTEYLTNPLGLDMPNPRLSWELRARSERARGLRQTAYQILVASTPAMLIPKLADLWDSGEVVSDETVLIDYHGNALTSRAVCFWTVRTRDARICFTPTGPSLLAKPAPLPYPAPIMKLSNKLEKALNDQINLEFVSAFAYLGMAAYFEHTAFTGFGKWMQLQSNEELGHAHRFFKYVVDRGGKVALEAIPQPKGSYKSPLEAFQVSLGHEQKVSAAICAI